MPPGMPRERNREGERYHMDRERRSTTTVEHHMEGRGAWVSAEAEFFPESATHLRRERPHCSTVWETRSKGNGKRKGSTERKAKQR